MTRGAKARATTPARASTQKASARGARPGTTARRQVAGAAQTTTDHERIRRWAEERRGAPATVKSTKRGGQGAGLLRIDFPGFSGARSLEKISWDDWFEQFEESNLAFLYQDKTKDGKQSRFFKLVDRK